jgi:hypothetical protein
MVNRFTCTDALSVASTADQIVACKAASSFFCSSANRGRGEGLMLRDSFPKLLKKSGISKPLIFNSFGKAA